MSSEKLGSAKELLKGNLGGSWDILEGSEGNYTDLGVARRFGGASAAYSLRDIGAMNGRVVRVRRDVDGQGSDPEEDFSANQVSSGALEDWVNGELESTLPADVATAAAAYSLRKVKASYAEDAVRIRRIDNTEVDVAFDLDGKVSTSSSITNVASGDVDNTSETTLGNFLQGEANVRALFNSSAYFPTDSDYFAINLTLSGAFTISFDVVFTGSFGTNTSRIFQDNNGDDLLTFTTSTTCKFRVKDPSSGGLVRTMPALSTALQLGRKYSMIFARDASGNYTLTIDGVQVSSVSGSDTDDFLIQRIGFRNRGSISNININSGQHIYVGDGADNANWTDTGSGTTSNATKVGTPVAFTGQGMDSFVDIWYDQAGSNDAVQATAGNQPKIAENGVLLANGLKFNGNSDNFTITNGVSGRSIFAVTNQNIDTTAGGVTGYGQDGISALLGTTLTDSYIFVTNNNPSFNSYAISLDGAVSDSGQYASNGKTLSSAGGNLGTYGDIPSDTNSLLSIIYGSGDPANAWTRLGSGITGNIFMQGSMSEVILYTSDQSNNRFKIESNINNYYGLYNDANEVTGDFIAVEGSGNSFTPNGTDGFILDIVTSTGYAGIQLNEKVTSGDNIFISFNADINRDSTPASFNLALRKTSVNGSIASSQQFAPTQGFNSYTLTSNDSDAEYIAFGEGSDNVGIEVTDFKVSRIARNGFVETWYDQSDNGRDMSQVSADQQPIIVNNGGQVKDPTNAKPSVKFGLQDDGTGGRNLRLTSNIPEATTNAFTHFVVASIDRNDITSARLTGGNIDLFLGSDERLATRFGDNKTNSSVPVLGVNSTTLLGAVVTTGLVPTLHFNDSTATLTAHTGTAVPTIVQLLGENAIGGDSLNRYHLSGTMSEVILYLEDKGSDVSELKNNINNFYNLY